MKTKHQTKTTERAMVETIVSGSQKQQEVLRQEISADLAALSVRAGRTIKRPKRRSCKRLPQRRRIGWAMFA